MRKRWYKCRVIIGGAAALFIALSPILYGFHLVLSHSHDGRNCAHGIVQTISFLPDPDHSGHHESDSCPLCQQFTQLLQNQFLLPLHIDVFFQDSFIQKQIDFFKDFISVSFNNIIPRAPPC